MKTEFIKETDNKGRTYIIEGEKKPGNVFSIKRFICEVQKQETEEETQQLADMLLEKLSYETEKIISNLEEAKHDLLRSPYLLDEFSPAIKNIDAAIKQAKNIS